ncbi:MAG: hypothetical protein V3T70_04405, partial [Phycisphaerae bacterium]
YLCIMRSGQFEQSTAAVIALGFAAALSLIAQRVGLTRPGWTLAAIVAIGFVALLDVAILVEPVPAMAAALVAGASAVLLQKTDQDIHAIGAGVVGGVGLITIALATIGILMN